MYLAWQALANCRTNVCKALGIPEELCELSMGMSGDFEQAVRIMILNGRPAAYIAGCKYNLAN